jgi:hypothetical protein
MQSNSVAVLSDFEVMKAADSAQDGANEEEYDNDDFADSIEPETAEDQPVEASDAMTEVYEFDPVVLPEVVTVNGSDGDLVQEISTRAELTLLLEELVGAVEEAQRSQLRKESTFRSPRPTTAAKVSLYTCILNWSPALTLQPTDATNEGSHAHPVDLPRPPGSSGVPHGALPGGSEMRCAGRHARHDPGSIRMVSGPEEPHGVLLCDPRRRRVAAEAGGAMFLPHSLALSDAGGDQ